MKNVNLGSHASICCTINVVCPAHKHFIMQCRLSYPAYLRRQLHDNVLRVVSKSMSQAASDACHKNAAIPTSCDGPETIKSTRGGSWTKSNISRACLQSPHIRLDSDRPPEMAIWRARDSCFLKTRLHGNISLHPGCTILVTEYPPHPLYACKTHLRLSRIRSKMGM